jgi:hypothetical protein
MESFLSVKPTSAAASEQGLLGRRGGSSGAFDCQTRVPQKPEHASRWRMQLPREHDGVPVDRDIRMAVIERFEKLLDKVDWNLQARLDRQHA